jgi:hypothetical protein
MSEVGGNGTGIGTPGSAGAPSVFGGSGTGMGTPGSATTLEYALGGSGTEQSDPGSAAQAAIVKNTLTTNKRNPLLRILPPQKFKDGANQQSAKFCKMVP